MTSAIGKLYNSLANALMPPPALSVAEWARANFRLSSDYSATAGSFEPYSFQVEPLDVLGPSNSADTVVLLTGAQTMKTLILLIFLAYLIDTDPGPALLVQPTESDAESFSRERLAPMLRDVPAMVGKVAESKSRSSGNTLTQKRFTGGSVSLTGAISPRGLRRRSVRYLLLDEIDGYEVTPDGDPVSLAAARTAKFWNRKIVMCSTPTVEGRSRIAAAFAESDQRFYHVPCPLCGHMQMLVWAGVRWGNVSGRQIAPEDAYYQCAECKQLIPHHRKLEMLRGGRWIATNSSGKYPGFSISRLYAPDWSWGRIVVDPIEGFLASKDDSARMQVFANNVLAECFKVRGEAPDYERLMARREPSYSLGQMPAEVLFLTAGVDVQKTWLEGYVWGWGRGRQRWVIDHFRIEHDPYNAMAWSELTERLNVSYAHPSGASLAISRLAIDTGFASNEVYNFARQEGTGRVLAVDGRHNGASLVGLPSLIDVTYRGQKISNGCKLWPVNVSMCKSELYAMLGKPRPGDGDPFPPGWVHFPHDMPDEFFLQLTAEELRTEVVKGYRRFMWRPIRERNEALDTANYARAAAAVLGMDQFQSQHWAALEAQLRVAPAPQASPQRPQQQTDRDGEPWIPSRNWFNRQSGY